MSYRPEGFINPYLQDGQDIEDKQFASAFESGADAMLEALKRGGILCVPANHLLTNLAVVMYVDGAWVFIPVDMPCEHDWIITDWLIGNGPEIGHGKVCKKCLTLFHDDKE